VSPVSWVQSKVVAIAVLAGQNLAEERPAGGGRAEVRVRRPLAGGKHEPATLACAHGHCCRLPCRGVWLDRGELDKLIASAEDAWGPDSSERSFGVDDDDDRRGQPSGGARRRPRRESWLGELFEFGS
jgi:Zn-finger nucleic acid-binding protein